MKKLISILLCGALTFTSCSDFLDTDSPSKQSSEVVFETESIAKAALMGIYSSLCGTYAYGQKLSVNWQGVSDIETNRGFSDTGYIDKTGDSGAGNFWCNWYNKTTQWGELFKLTELASTAVDGIRKSSLLGSSDVMKRYLGEALVLRSMGYFELLRWWGDIPFKDEPSKSDLSNVYMNKTDKDIAYAAIVKDMQEAIEYLPWLGEESEYNCERITKGFAKGLLARIALFAGGWSVRDGNQFSDANVEHHPDIEEINGYYVGRPKNWRDFYEIAEQQCAEMIGDPENPHALDPDFGNIWKTVCHLDYNKFNENLFEVGFGLGQNGDIGSLMGYSLGANTQYGSRGFGGSYVATTGYYFYSFDREDLRRDYGATWFSYTSENKEKMGNDILTVMLGKWNFFWTNDTYKSMHKTANSRISTGINWIVMRYSDVLLMFAEARNALVGADEVSTVAKISARQALEQVRERAFGAGSPKVKEYDPDFFEAIVNERAWEFGGEAIRKQDLVRWGLLDKKIEDMKRALCYMMDGSKPVTIFDKTYQPADIPTMVYYKFKDDNEFIDINSINFYEELPANPDETVYQEAKWCSKNFEKPEKGDKTPHVDGPVKVLLAATGLMADYDYSSLFGELQHGSEISSRFVQYEVGNKTCNYRHVYAIYYEDIYESKGYLSNSYGY